MRAINHSLTGAVIGLTVADPLIAAPLAFVSHYFMDAIPHSSFSFRKDGSVDRLFIFQIILDAVLCLILVAVLIIDRPIHWVTAIVCAFLAAAPDFFSANFFYKTLKHKPYKPSLYFRFASKIQWFEKPIGLVVETVWLFCFIFCLSIFLQR
ncbi:MAG TPA: hypothetical protein VGF75_03345 [Candidatus Saccharimonadales bacterium]|jgi:hypothetical protein